MALPLAFLQHGNINIEAGGDTSLQGYGDIYVNRSASLGFGEIVNSIGTTSGNLVVYGGAGIVQDSFLGGLLTVSSTSNLQSTFINTSLGVLSVSGGNSMTVAVGGAVSITSTGGNSSVISSNNSAIIQGGINNSNAIQIIATNAAGGVNVLSGQSSQIQLTAGTGGIQEVTSSGSINLTANNGSGSFIVNAETSNQNLTFSQSGAFDSGIIIQSAGTNVTNTAILINAVNTAGNILIENSGGTGGGSITALAGSAGYIVTTNTGGPIQMSANGAASFLQINSSAGNQNLTIGVNGISDSKLILQSSGTNATQAILIQTTNTAGGISITQPVGSSGGINITSGSSGITARTQTGGGINLTANGAASSFINATTSTNQNLTIAVQGSTDSKVIISSTGTGAQAINIVSSTGGIYALAGGAIQINTSDASNGVNIGTLIPGVPVRIGTNSSVTTVYGSLDVLGTTTTIESVITQITDNLIQLNNAPSGTADAGVAIKRYQSANDTSLGDVVADTPENTPGKLAQAGASGTIILNIADHNVTTDHYSGYWIKIISGTGSGQVRRIKSYNTVTDVATIYSTADQTGVLVNPTPVEGLDWTTIPDNTSFYGLYPCEWIIALWDEVSNEYSIVCSNMISNASGTPPIAHYVDLHVNDIIANNITATSINNTTADSTTTVTLTNNSITPVVITGMPATYGTFILIVRPTTASSTRPHAIFMCARLNNATDIGSSVRLVVARGISLDAIDISWPANSKPSLRYLPAPGGGGTVSYTIKIITV